MFQLEERQLHILMFLMLGASIILFCLLGIERISSPDKQGMVQGMTDFSDGWVCTYETDDANKLEEYHNSLEEDFNEEDRTIQEINTFPMTLPVAKETSLLLVHRVPGIKLETQYLLLQTKKTAVQVSIGEDVIYQSSDRENRINSYHLIPLGPEYKDEVLRIEMSGHPRSTMQVCTIYTGTRNQLWLSLLSENGNILVIGFVFTCISLCMLLLYALMNNTWRQKRLLLYSSLEGIVFGILFLMEGQLIVVLSGWNYGIALLRTCLIFMASVLHLMVIRCFVHEKKMLSALDIGILVYGVLYISVMVLQGFSIVQLDTVYIVGKWLLAVCSLIYVVVLAVEANRYGKKEYILPLTANIIFLTGGVVQVIMWLLRVYSSSGVMWYLLTGIAAYMIFVWVVALKQALYVVPKEEEESYSEEEIRAQAVERLNPNLIFASLHSLQNLIKNGSDNSIKMIYYISVYIRNNLIALEKAGEMIPFEEELEHIIAYLQLQKMRNAGLSFTFECKVKDFQVPRHTLEPMVENAVKYGVGGKDNRGNIAIRTYMRAEGYAVQIIDDGIGFDQQTLTRHSATALLSLLDVLKQTCQAKAEIISKDGKGTVITVVLPILEYDDMDITEELGL